MFLECIKNKTKKKTLSIFEIIELTDLRLKTKALNPLIPIPLVVKEGFIGRAEIHVPWTSLSSKPTVIRISDVYILAEPQEEAAFDEEEEDARQLALKLDRLESADQKVESAPTEEELRAFAQENEGFVHRLVNTIIANLQVFVDRVHIRYEDDETVPESPFSVGLTLGLTFFFFFFFFKKGFFFFFFFF